jgi:hypothetical protein
VGQVSAQKKKKKKKKKTLKFGPTCTGWKKSNPYLPKKKKNLNLADWGMAGLVGRIGWVFAHL